MQEHVSRLLGLDGFVVIGVDEVGEQLDLQVELFAGAPVACPGCDGVEVGIKDRRCVRVRDLPLFGRVTYLVWRKRRYRCEECGRLFTERHEQLPARQRVTGRFRQRLLERVVGGFGACGHARASAVRSDHAQVAPVEGRRRPRVATLTALGQASGAVVATALIDDGGVANYALRLTVRAEQAGGWLVSSVDGG